MADCLYIDRALGMVAPEQPVQMRYIYRLHENTGIILTE